MPMNKVLPLQDVHKELTGEYLKICVLPLLDAYGYAEICLLPLQDVYE